jgi:hypothetical protein
LWAFVVIVVMIDLILVWVYACVGGIYILGFLIASYSFMSIVQIQSAPRESLITKLPGFSGIIPSMNFHYFFKNKGYVFVSIMWFLTMCPNWSCVTGPFNFIKPRELCAYIATKSIQLDAARFKFTNHIS